MSIKLMSAIFETEMRDLEYIKDGEPRKTKASTAKLVLLALADHANDYGESSYPGYDKLEIKTALSRQGISDTLEALKHNGLLTVNIKGSSLGTNDYTINIRSFPPMFKEAADLPELVKPLDSPESSHLTNTSQATLLESSSNHQINHPNGGLSEKELSQANAQVDAMIANSKKVKYQNRDKVPEPYLVFADLYHELTQQEPTKRVIFDWFSTFEDWKAEGLQPDHIRAAWQYANRSDGGFPVGRPGALTKTAVAMKSKMLQSQSKPAINEDAVEATKRLIEQKNSGQFVPPPPGLRPAIAIKSLADRKGVRK